MQNTITIHSVSTSESMIRPQGDPVVVYLVNVVSSDGPLTLEFPEEAARHMSAQLATLLPNRTEK